MSVDRPYNIASSIGQMRTRVQAFVESIEIKSFREVQGNGAGGKQSGNVSAKSGLACFLTAAKVRRRREWRGIKDTLYDYGRWLYLLSILAGVIIKAPQRQGHVQVPLVRKLPRRAAHAG